MNSYCDTFGAYLTRHRNELGLTGKEFAAKLGISHTYYNTFETGKRNAPERDVLDAMADILMLSDTERTTLYDLAGQTRGLVAADLPDYINDNPYVRVALRRARDINASADQWLRFIAQLEEEAEL